MCPSSQAHNMACPPRILGVIRSILPALPSAPCGVRRPDRRRRACRRCTSSRPLEHGDRSLGRPSEGRCGLRGAGLSRAEPRSDVPAAHPWRDPNHRPMTARPAGNCSLKLLELPRRTRTGPRAQFLRPIQPRPFGLARGTLSAFEQSLTWKFVNGSPVIASLPEAEFRRQRRRTETL